MDNEKEKYANGESIDTFKMSKDEKRKAIEYWCEGNQQLKKLLLYFNDKDIQTIGCCSGHEKSDLDPTGNSAYIAIALDDKYNDLIDNLFAKTEEKGIELYGAYEIDKVQQNFCILSSVKKGFNEKFFEQLNECCIELEQNNPISESSKNTYNMLGVLARDKRIIEKSKIGYMEYVFLNGDNKVRTLGFLDYGSKVVNIPCEEIERMGKWLKENSESEIPKDFCGSRIMRTIYPLKHLKQKAKESKLPLKMINKAYEWIRNTIRGNNFANKKQEESERS